jgi:hypothetical protein
MPWNAELGEELERRFPHVGEEVERRVLGGEAERQGLRALNPILVDVAARSLRRWRETARGRLPRGGLPAWLRHER